MSLSEVKSDYRLAVGQLTLDLTSVSVPVTGAARTVRARVGVGQLIVDLPSDQVAVVRGHAGVGQVTIFDRSDQGFGVDKDVTTSVPAGEPITFSLELSVGIGEVRVQHG
jgi:predicted membrane protein